MNGSSFFFFSNMRKKGFSLAEENINKFNSERTPLCLYPFQSSPSSSFLRRFLKRGSLKEFIFILLLIIEKMFFFRARERLEFSRPFVQRESQNMIRNPLIFEHTSARSFNFISTPSPSRFVRWHVQVSRDQDQSRNLAVLRPVRSYCLLFCTWKRKLFRQSLSAVKPVEGGVQCTRSY